MEAKTNGRVQRSVAEWQQILNRFAESGRSRAAFCRAEGLSPATFDVWRRSGRPCLPRTVLHRRTKIVEILACPLLVYVAGWAGMTGDGRG